MSVWGTPGGGIEPDEDVATALRRELAEELGLDDFSIGPQVWERVHIIPFLDGRWDGQHDRFYLVDVEPFEPAPRLSVEQLRAENLFQIRWWTQDELASFVPTDVGTVRPAEAPPAGRHAAQPTVCPPLRSNRGVAGRCVSTLGPSDDRRRPAHRCRRPLCRQSHIARPPRSSCSTTCASSSPSPSSRRSCTTSSSSAASPTGSSGSSPPSSASGGHG